MASTATNPWTVGSVYPSEAGGGAAATGTQTPFSAAEYNQINGAQQGSNNQFSSTGYDWGSATGYPSTTATGTQEWLGAAIAPKLPDTWGQPTGGYQPSGATNYGVDPSTGGTAPQAYMENAFQQQGGQYLGGTNSQAYNNATFPALMGPTSMSTLYDSMIGASGDPTASSMALSGAASSLGGSGNAQNVFQQYGSQYMDPSSTGAVLGAAAGQLGGPSESQGYLPTAMGVAGAPSDLAQHQGDISGLYNGASNVQQWQGANGGQLSGPGALEQFAASDMAGKNPYFDMLQKQQADTIDQAAASRGAYGAGGSLAAQALGSANLRAQQYQQEGQLQGAAQQAQQSRLGLGANVAGMASNERMGQGNALSGLYQSMYGDRLQGANLGLQATGQADNTLLARTGLLGQLAGQDDNQRLNALAGMGNMANQADSSQLARSGLIGQLAGQTDTANQNRLNSQITAGSNVDATALQRAMLGSQMAGQADTQNLNWLNAYMNQAGAAQGAAQTRTDQEMNQLFQSAALQSGLFSNFYGNGGQQSVDAGVGSVNAATNAVSTAAAASQAGNKNVLGGLFSLIGG